ncbi:hypothetical protein BDM02DRAFT_3121346 [Thelephora ganbajun]|uniref:Uncharacterized protein n=1 Tax=Thelephora ganbajun TaxID=370292 RepID=A0ACB6Z6I3_THEGA|nr:hypothetical protein BDM02DRAFT_3121346 [Thelephora ganbajun]
MKPGDFLKVASSWDGLRSVIIMKSELWTQWGSFSSRRVAHLLKFSRLYSSPVPGSRS